VVTFITLGQATRNQGSGGGRLLRRILALGLGHRARGFYNRHAGSRFWCWLHRCGDDRPLRPDYGYQSHFRVPTSDAPKAKDTAFLGRLPAQNA
jgi:hypothetical protein